MKLQGESGHLAKKQTRNIAEPFWSLCHGKKGGGFGRAAGEGKMLSVASAELDPPTGGIGGWGFFFFFLFNSEHLQEVHCIFLSVCGLTSGLFPK